MAKILYIEDHEDVRESTEKVLTRLHGCTVISRPNTDKVDALADQWKPDLIITDHELGHGKERGLDLAIRLKANGYKVAILSASLEAQEGAAAAEIPFFLKPYGIGALLKEMEVTV